MLTLELFDQEDRRRGLRDLVEYNIEGLSSLKTLHLGSYAREIHFSIRNLPSLINLSVYSDSSCRIDEKFVKILFDQVPNIQELHLDGKLCYFNLDDFVNLRTLSISGSIFESFNFELFKNLSKQLENIKIGLFINEENFFKLFVGYNFPYLQDFSIENFEMKRLKKEFLNRLPTHTRLNIRECEIEVIESDSFSNMQQLTSLDLSLNHIEFIEENAFSKLNNLQTLDLRHNCSLEFDRKFTGLGNSVKVKVKFTDV